MNFTEHRQVVKPCCWEAVPDVSRRWCWNLYRAAGSKEIELSAWTSQYTTKLWLHHRDPDFNNEDTKSWLLGFMCFWSSSCWKALSWGSATLTVLEAWIHQQQRHFIPSGLLSKSCSATRNPQNVFQHPCIYSHHQSASLWQLLLCCKKKLLQAPSSFSSWLGLAHTLSQSLEFHYMIWSVLAILCISDLHCRITIAKKSAGKTLQSARSERTTNIYKRTEKVQEQSKETKCQMLHSPLFWEWITKMILTCHIILKNLEPCTR